jgi:hypothetical protein
MQVLTTALRPHSPQEHDLLLSQALHTLTSTLLSDVARLGAKSDRRQVPELATDCH